MNKYTSTYRGTVFLMSLAESFISRPPREFYLKHLVCINYGGKVYAVLRGIEVATEVEGVHRGLYITYAVCMLLGMFWYTRFWTGEDLKQFYSTSVLQKHALKDIGVAYILSGATLYYLIFGVLFTVAYTDNSHATALALSLWNYWCAILLMLANCAS